MFSIVQIFLKEGILALDSTWFRFTGSIQSSVIDRACTILLVNATILCCWEFRGAQSCNKSSCRLCASPPATNAKRGAFSGSCKFHKETVAGYGSDGLHACKCLTWTHNQTINIIKYSICESQALCLLAELNLQYGLLCCTSSPLRPRGSREQPAQNLHSLLLKQGHCVCVRACQ